VRLAVLFVIAACTSKHQADYLAYDWDARRILCSDAIDDLDGTSVNWGFIDGQLKLAHEHGWVMMLHAHTPGVTVSTDALEHALSTADQYQLASLTFRDFDPAGPKTAGLALAFDDNAPDQWMTVRDLLANHHAHATFFVSRWQDMTPAQHQELAILHEDGDDLEPHTVNHLHAIDYVKQHGLDAYIQDEVLPSFDVLTAAGFPPAAAFAYPFGEHDTEIDDAVLKYVARVRTTPGECPW
jgi:peptidoglycan/xylan/chitin deacetylase (PgdA/CDA1 family)